MTDSAVRFRPVEARRASGHTGRVLRADWYRARDRVVSNLWLVPSVYVVAALIAGYAVPHWDRQSPVTDVALDATSVTDALGAIAAGMITFTGLVFSIVMLIVQFGSGAFSTRLMRWFWRSPVVKHALGMFIATFLFALVGLAQVNSASATFVPTRTFLATLALVVLSVALFLAMLARMSTLLRVARVTRELGLQTEQVIDTMFPLPYESPDERDFHVVDREPDHVIRHVGVSASLTALDRRGLTRLAERHDVLLVLVPSVGDHVSSGTVLFEIYGATAPAARTLRRGLVFGDERTIDYDPSFGFRLLVDVALKALSPAVNDPTTAVQVLDRLEDLLRHAAGRKLRVGVDRDAQGTPRFLYPQPSWDDLLELALDEIRTYGASSLQVGRRMAALLDRLDEDVPPARRPTVDAFRRRLAATMAQGLVDPADVTFATTPDRQGIGRGAAESLTTPS